MNRKLILIAILFCAGCEQKEYCRQEGLAEDAAQDAMGRATSRSELDRLDRIDGSRFDGWEECVRREDNSSWPVLLHLKYPWKGYKRTSGYQHGVRAEERD